MSCEPERDRLTILALEKAEPLLPCTLVYLKEAVRDRFNAVEDANVIERESNRLEHSSVSCEMCFSLLGRPNQIERPFPRWLCCMKQSFDATLRGR
jgi:hypothetical protein